MKEVITCRSQYRPVDPMLTPAPGMSNQPPFTLNVRRSAVDLCGECEDRIINVLSTDLRTRFGLSTDKIDDMHDVEPEVLWTCACDWEDKAKPMIDGGTRAIATLSPCEMHRQWAEQYRDRKR
jgi:hypothetical protein